jgi:hypothetical protein
VPPTPTPAPAGTPSPTPILAPAPALPGGVPYDVLAFAGIVALLLGALGWLRLRARR